MFVTFEGIEGSGKSTQLKRLAQELESRGVSVVCTHEPGGTPVGEAIRAILLDPHSRMEPGTELFLMMASRRELVDQVVRPALRDGKVVLSDRYVDASFAYQGFGRGVPEEAVRQLARWACEEVWPDHTVLFDLEASEGLARCLPLQKAESQSGQGDRIERCGAEFLEKVRRGYLELARRDPQRFVVIPVTGTEEETYKLMVSALRPLLGTLLLGTPLLGT